MSYSNFDFLKSDFPEILSLAENTEYLISQDPFAAMINIQQITRNVIKNIVGNNGVVASNPHMDGVIHSLWINKMISDDMYRALKEIELFDSRESEIFVDLSKIEHLFIRVYDFTVWFYKSYVNDAFIPNTFINPLTKTMSLVTQQELEMEMLDQLFSIDGVVHKAKWVKLPKDYVTINYENGERYEGQIHKGFKHGKGKYTWPDGTIYIGFWSNDLEHGYGKKFFANDDVYRGNWKNGAFHGQGAYIWNNGQIYEGQWEDGFEHGFGSKTTSKGVKTRGHWMYGEFQNR